MRRVMVLLAGGLALGGCATTGEQPIPANYRQMIVEFAKTGYYFDPYSLRDVSIGAPKATVALFGPAHIVCVRANAKNRLGGYIGIKASPFVISGGKVVTVWNDDYGIHCGGTAYEPFPELEGGGPRGGKS